MAFARVTMKKSVKITIAILAIVAILLGMIYLFLSAVNKTLPQELVLPKGGLSQSIFDSQNMKYTPNANLTQVHLYEHSPYQFDISNSDSAKLGTNGTVYKLSDTMYVYTTECAKEDQLENSIKSELSKAVMIDSDDTMTVLDNYVIEQGYINGFKADYRIDCLTVSNGNRTASVYLTGYALTITDNEYDHGYRLYIGIVTAVKDTVTFNNAKTLLDILIATYQFNEDTQQALVREEEAAAQDAARAEAAAQREAEKQAAQDAKHNETVVSSDGSTSDMASNAAQSTTNSTTPVPGSTGSTNVIPQYKEMSVTIDQEYTNVSLYYYYTNVDNEVQVVLYSPDKTAEYQPITNSNGTVLFQLDKMEAGKWVVGITGDFGENSMKLYSDQTQTATE